MQEKVWGPASTGIGVRSCPGSGLWAQGSSGDGASCLPVGVCLVYPSHMRPRLCTRARQAPAGPTQSPGAPEEHTGGRSQGSGHHRAGGVSRGSGCHGVVGCHGAVGGHRAGGRHGAVVSWGSRRHGEGGRSLGGGCHGVAGVTGGDSSAGGPQCTRLRPPSLCLPSFGGQSWGPSFPSLGLSEVIYVVLKPSVAPTVVSWHVPQPEA